MFYVRATGSNQLAGGTDKWLKIRSLRECGASSYEIGVVIRDQKKFTVVDTSDRIKYLEFAKGWPGLMPVGFHTVLKNWED